MAGKVFYLLQELASGASHHNMSDGVDPGTSTITTGWNVGKAAASTYAGMVAGIEVSTAAFLTTGLPLASVGTNDCFRTPTQLTGTFAAANWVATFPVVAVGGGGDQDGRLRLRLWKAASSTGAGATQITASTESTNVLTNLAAATPQNAAVTFAPGSIVLNDQFLFFQLAWQITGAGGNANRDVQFRTGASAKVETADFVAADASVVVSRYRWYADDGSESAASAIAAENTVYTSAKAGTPVVLRVQLQNEAAQAGSIADDYELQYSISSAVTWIGVSTAARGIASRDSSNLTGTASTTARLTAGTGSFSFGLISEDGTVNNNKIGTSNYTELLYSLEIRDVLPTAPVQFRIARNGTALAMRQTPQLRVEGTRFYLQNTSTVHGLKSASGAFYLSMDDTAQSSTVVGRRAITSVVTGLGLQFEEATETAFLNWVSRRVLSSTVLSGPMYVQVWGSQSSAAVSAVVAATLNRFQPGSSTGGFLQEVLSVRDNDELGTSTALQTFSSTLPANASTSWIGGERIGFRIYAAPLGSTLPNGGSAVVRFAGSTDSDGFSFFQLGQTVNFVSNEVLYNIDEWRFYADGTEAGSAALAASTVNASTTASTITQIRFRISETNNGVTFLTDDWQLQYRHNGGTWANVSATASVVVPANGALTDAEATTNRLGGSGTFIAGKVDEGDGIVADSAWGSTTFSELLWSFRVVSAQVSTHDTIDFRVTYFTFGNHWVVPNSPALPRVVIVEASVAAPTPVSQDLTTLWAINERIGQEKTALWNIQERVGQEKTALWNIQERVGQEKTALWNIQERIGQNVTELWAVQERIGQNVTELWSINERVGQEKTVTYNVVNDRAIITWAEVTLPSAESAVSKDLAVTWGINERIGQNVSPLWNIQERIGQNVTELWAVQERVGQNVSPLWNIQERIGQNVSPLWNIQERVGQEVAVVWSILVSAVAGSPPDTPVTLGSQNQNSPTVTLSTAANIPAGGLVIAIAAARKNGGPPSTPEITGGGFSWTELHLRSVDFAANPDMVVRAWWAVAAASTTAPTIVASAAGSGTTTLNACYVTNASTTFANASSGTNTAGDPSVQIGTVGVTSFLFGYFAGAGTAQPTNPAGFNQINQSNLNSLRTTLCYATTTSGGPHVWDSTDTNAIGLLFEVQTSTVGAGTTAVNRDVDVTWAIQERIGQNVSPTWAINERIGQNVTELWAIQERIGQNVSPTWAIRERIGQNVSPVWAVRERVGKELTATWSILASVQDGVVTKNLTALWQINERINKTNVVLWSLEERVGKQSDSVWNIQERVGKQVEAVWNIPTSPVGRQLDLIWAATERVAKSYDTLWGVQERVARDTTQIWEILHAVSRAAVILYNVSGSAPDPSFYHNSEQDAAQAGAHAAATKAGQSATTRPGNTASARPSFTVRTR